MTIPENVKKIVDSAIQLENDGVEFYTNAFNKVSHPLGKAVFKSFIEEEKSHITKIKKLFSTETNIEELTPMKSHDEHLDRLKSVFQEMYEEGDVAINPNTDDIQAVHAAIDFEKKGKKVYDDAVALASDQKEREILTILSNEEAAHLAVLKNMHDELERHYQEDAQNELRGQLEWEKKLFMQSGAQARDEVVMHYHQGSKARL